MKKSQPILCVAAALALAASAPAKETLIIHHGWAQPSFDQLKAHVAEMEEEAPFDGLVFHMGVTDVMGPNEIRYGDAPKDCLVKYRKIKFKRYKHNFAMTMADQNKPDWFSDKYWKTVAKNFATAADLVAKAEMAGICFDPEGYGVYPVNSYWTSKYFLAQEAKPEWKGEKHTKKQYLEAARARGREVGTAMFAKNPKLRFWGLYLWSMDADLMGAFCNGLLDVMPKTAAIIDGDEWRGYCATGEGPYKNLEARANSGCGFLDKKYRSSYRRMGQLAVAFYMDFYTDVKSPFYEGNAEAFKDSAKRFRENVRFAKQVTGDYMWVYGEKGQWWDMTKYDAQNKFKPWEEQLPGVTEALFKGRLSASAAPKGRGAKNNAKNKRNGGKKK